MVPRGSGPACDALLVAVRTALGIIDDCSAAMLPVAMDTNIMTRNIRQLVDMENMKTVVGCRGRSLEADPHNGWWGSGVDARPMMEEHPASCCMLKCGRLHIRPLNGVYMSGTGQGSGAIPFRMGINPIACRRGPVERTTRAAGGTHYVLSMFWLQCSKLFIGRMKGPKKCSLFTGLWLALFPLSLNEDLVVSGDLWSTGHVTVTG